MATRLGVGDLKVVKKGKLSDGTIGYILENTVEIVDTFAERHHLIVTADSVLG